MSCRQYAKRRGVTPMAVSVAIKVGRLRASVGRDENGQPKIVDPDLADREWAENTDHYKRPPAPAQVRVETGAFDDDTHDEEDPNAAPTLANAAAREKHWRAELAQLKFQEASGLLLDKSKTEREWVDVASKVKTKLLGVPSRARQALPHLTVADIGTLTTLVREILDEIADGHW